MLIPDQPLIRNHLYLITWYHAMLALMPLRLRCSDISATDISATDVSATDTSATDISANGHFGHGHFGHGIIYLFASAAVRARV